MISSNKKNAAMIEFHFDFFSPFVENLKGEGVNVVLWTAQPAMLNILPDEIIKYNSKYAQMGCDVQGNALQDHVDLGVFEIFKSVWPVILDQSKRFIEYEGWDNETVMLHSCKVAAYWKQIILDNNIDVLIYKTEPHMFFDLILYMVGENAGVKNIYFERLHYNNRVIACTSIFYKLDELNARIGELEVYKKELKESVEENYYVPSYHYLYKKSKLNSRTLKIVNKIVGGNLITQLQRYVIRYRTNKRVWCQIGKKGLCKYYCSWLTYVLDAAINKIRILFRKKLYYFINMFLFRKKFSGGVLVTLQCQPERSTNPCGGLFYHDQVKMIEDLRSLLSDDVVINIKEHPSQFTLYQNAEFGRSLSFYRRLQKIDNVRFVGGKFNSEDLLNDCSMLVSIGGSTAWKALAAGVNAVVCGHVAYACCKAAFFAPNKSSMSEALNKIKKNNRGAAPMSEMIDEYKINMNEISCQGYLDNVYRTKFASDYDNIGCLMSLLNYHLNVDS